MFTPGVNKLVKKVVVCYKLSMKDCVFCQIVKREIPCYKVYEDQFFLGFLDIFPRVKGHSLLIPKKHYRWVYDLPNFGEYWEKVLKLTKAMKKALRPKFITYVTHGLEVSHAHVHILPRQTETEFVPPTIKLKEDEMKEIADKIFDAVKKED